MSNKLTDLNDVLFEQLKRLNADDLSPEKLEQETLRAKAMVQVSVQITTISNQQLRATEIVARHGDRHRKAFPMIIEHEEGSST